MRETDASPALPWLVAGFIVWSSAFIALYGMHGLGCALEWDARGVGPLSVLRVALLAVWAAHVAVAAWIVGAAWHRARAARGARGFIGSLAVVLGTCALAATIWVGVPVLAMPVCE